MTNGFDEMILNKMCIRDREYSKEDLMEAKRQILGVGENMGTAESKKIWEKNAQFWDDAMGEDVYRRQSNKSQSHRSGSCPLGKTSPSTLNCRIAFLSGFFASCLSLIHISRFCAHLMHREKRKINVYSSI